MGVVVAREVSKRDGIFCTLQALPDRQWVEIKESNDSVTVVP